MPESNLCSVILQAVERVGSYNVVNACCAVLLGSAGALTAIGAGIKVVFSAISLNSFISMQLQASHLSNHILVVWLQPLPKTFFFTIVDFPSPHDNYLFDFTLRLCCLTIDFGLRIWRDGVGRRESRRHRAQRLTTRTHLLMS